MSANSGKINFLLNGSVLEELKNEYKDVSTTGIYFIDINELLIKSGSTRQVSSPFSDQLFVHQLLKTRPGNKYAQPREKRYNSMRNTRLALLACSALIMVASFIWSGITIMQGVDFRQNTLSANSKTDFYTTRYQIARERLPQTPVEPADLKVAVEIINDLQGYKTTPIEMIRLVSIVMNRFPNIKLGDFQWASSVNPNLSMGVGSTSTNQGVIGYSNITGSENDFNYYQIAIIDGEIDLPPFSRTYS